MVDLLRACGLASFATIQYPDEVPRVASAYIYAQSNRDARAKSQKLKFPRG